jgi:hypothetical protein
VPDTWITDEMRAAIGRPVGKKRVSFPITASARSQKYAGGGSG